MRTGIRSCLLAGLAVIACVAQGAAHEPWVLRLGSLELSYDTARWTMQGAGEHAFDFKPVGESSRNHEDVRVTWKPSERSEGCQAEVRQVLWSEMYEQPVATSVEIAGIAAERFVADTRCRNAVPKGIVICVPRRDGVYLIAATRSSCRDGGRSPFSGVDPLEELARGAKFSPETP